MCVFGDESCEGGRVKLVLGFFFRLFLSFGVRVYSLFLGVSGRRKL